jgi:hypothetical protein
MLRTTLLIDIILVLRCESVGVQSEALLLHGMALEFKAKLCSAVTKLRFELQRAHYVLL